MSTLQPTQTNSLSPILLSPSSTTLTNPLTVFDNSDQGSVDSDYTSLGSSKFYGNSGSTSSLHRQGRSQSIDELAQNSTTNIPTRHFNGVSTGTKTTNDPLQFVKVQPSHDLIERAQEQISLAESRKRLQDNYKLLNRSNGKKLQDDDDIDWSKAVDSWKQKRELKRLKSDNSNSTTNNGRSISPLKVEPVIKSDQTNKVNKEPIQSLPSPPVIKSKPKSPSPFRNRGPSKIREISIEKPVDVRGFGFKLEDGRAQNRAVYISTIEEGSPADKAGLYVDDEIISMNDDNIEKLTFDQVRKILKERNLRGTIKLIVKTYEDTTDDNSQTVVSAPTTDHSRTPSPQKHLTSQIPIYEVVAPYAEPVKNQSAPSSSVNIFAPKPYRSNNEPVNHHEPTTPVVIEKQPMNNSPANIIVNQPAINPSIETIKQTRNESPIAQVRSLVEKQMDQLQQDLEFGFSRTPKSPPVAPPPPPPIVREQQRPVINPVEFSPSQEPLRSSLKKSYSTQNELDQIPSNRTYGLKINPNEQVIHYLDPYTQSRPLVSQNKRSIPDLTTVHRPATTTQTIERTFNELKINMPASYSSQPHIVNQQQKKVTIQLGAKTPPLPQRTSSKNINHPSRKTHFEDQTQINNEQNKAMMYNHPTRNPSPTHRQTRAKSPNRVLSVSGRLRCSKCSEELGQGSAMVIESLGLYYHIECFRCCVCNIPLSSSFEGTDVRVRNNRLHCQNCFSDDNGVKLSAV